MSKIRPIAIAIIQQAGKILVFRGWDECDQRSFYRPLGGGIEFGETGEQALRRELAEEIGAKLTDVRYLFTLENIFQCNGRPGHEIVLVFAAELADPAFYFRTEIIGQEDSGDPLPVVWMPLSDFANGAEILVPEDLLARILSH